MNKELSEILTGFQRTLALLEKPEKTMLVVASIIMAIAGVLTNIPAVALGKLVDQLAELQEIEFSIALPYIFLIVVVILLREALTVVRKYFVENIATQTEKKQTVHAIERVLKADIARINAQQIGSLHGRIFRSIQGLVRIIKLGFLDFFPTFFTAIAAMGIAFYQKPTLATIMILVIPAGLYIVIRQVASQKGIRVALLRGKEKIDGTVVEMLGGIETVRALNTEVREIEKVESVAEELRKREIKHHISMSLFDALKYLNEGFFYIAVIALAIFFSAEGLISKGDILLYSILFLSITAPLREIHRVLDEAHESSIRVNDLYELLDAPLDVSFEADIGKSSGKSQEPAIRVERLSFSYSSSKHPIVQNVSFTVKRGEKIGIVGASGGGKSTIAKILLRLVHNYTGSVQVLGTDLREMTRAEIAERIAYVPQKTYVFSGTIRENIAYGCPRTISEEDILRAARSANIWDEIEHSLGGLDGRVAENGNNLSGGQKQRLAIARLVLASPEILIFDEATSALDNTNETTIQRNIEELFKNATMLLIAHRLTTLKNCDRILVFDKGKIVQEGSFEHLANTKGLFQDFLHQRATEH